MKYLVAGKIERYHSGVKQMTNAEDDFGAPPDAPKVEKTIGAALNYLSTILTLLEGL